MPCCNQKRIQFLPLFVSFLRDRNRASGKQLSQGSSVVVLPRHAQRKTSSMVQLSHSIMVGSVRQDSSLNLSAGVAPHGVFILALISSSFWDLTIFGSLSARNFKKSLSHRHEHSSLSCSPQGARTRTSIRPVAPCLSFKLFDNLRSFAWLDLTYLLFESF